MARYSDILLYENPRRGKRRRSRRNPASALAMPRPLRRWMQGVGFVDVAGAVGGLFATTTIPSMIITTTVTPWQKFSKVAVSLIAAMSAGYIGGQISSSVGKAALLGGLAGFGTQILSAYTPFQLGKQSIRRRIGETTRLSPLSEGRESEITSVIEP